MSFLLSSCCLKCDSEQPECEYDLSHTENDFWSFKESNWPESVPVFDTEFITEDDVGTGSGYIYINRIRFKNKGAFTLVYDTENPLSNYEYLSIEASFFTDTLVGEAGVCFMNPWEPESISLWWLGGSDYELRQGGTVLQAFSSSAPPQPGIPTSTVVKLVIKKAKQAITDVECWIQGVLEHTETDVSWARPELLDYGICVDGEVIAWRVFASPCAIPCEVISECGVDNESPALWVLTVPTITNNTNPNANGVKAWCQDSVSQFFSNSHTLYRQFDGITQALVRADVNQTTLPLEYEWEDCPVVANPGNTNYSHNCYWISVITASQSINTDAYRCFNPRPSPMPTDPLQCNRRIINQRNEYKYPILDKGFCPVVWNADTNQYEPTDDWLGPTAYGTICNMQGGQTWRLYLLSSFDAAQWQRDQDGVIPDGSWQVIARCEWSYLVTDPVEGEVERAGGAIYHSDWFPPNQPIPSSEPITLTRQDIKYPIQPYSPGEWWDFPDEITALPNGIGDNDAYTRYCRGLTCQPILDPEEDAEYQLDMLYEFPDSTVISDRAILTAYFQEDDESWEWFGPGGHVFTDDCDLGVPYYHIHCVKEANGGRGQWVLDVTLYPDNNAVTSRLNLYVDEELGMTFEGTLIGCDGQQIDGLTEYFGTPVFTHFGPCEQAISTPAGTLEVTCMFDPIVESGTFRLRPHWGSKPAYMTGDVLKGVAVVNGKAFTIYAFIQSGFLNFEIHGMRPDNTYGYLTGVVSTYSCHPIYGYPVFDDIYIPYSWGDTPDPFGVCPGTYGNSEIGLIWS